MDDAYAGDGVFVKVISNSRSAVYVPTVQSVTLCRILYSTVQRTYCTVCTTLQIKKLLLLKMRCHLSDIIMLSLSIHSLRALAMHHLGIFMLFRISVCIQYKMC